jgi:hypothetical protein
MTEGRTDPPAPGTAAPDPTETAIAIGAATPSGPVDGGDLVATAGQPRRSRVWTSGAIGRWAVGGLSVVIAVATVATFTVDLGSLVRARAEEAVSGYLDREVTIGRVGAYLVPGRFLVEDLMIGGLRPDDQPFLVADEIVLSTTWLALLHGEFLIDSATMTNWLMRIESFPDGRQSFPAFTSRELDEAVEVPETTVQSIGSATNETDEGLRFVSTLQYVQAASGEFRYEDHGSNYEIICPNFDITITKIFDYRGHASCSEGLITISDFEPMWANMATDFELDGAKVDLTRFHIETDGASTDVQGDIDLLAFPEMLYTLESDIDAIRMREIFFADNAFTASGDSHFSGSFHKFDGGYDLRGSISSPVFNLNVDAGQFRFPNVEGQLVWQPERFDMWDITSSLYGGRAVAELSSFGLKEPWQGSFDVRYEDVEVSQLARVFEWNGIEPVSRAGGHHRFEWPIDGDGGFRHEGEMQFEPPEGVQLASAEIRPDAVAAVAARAALPPDLTTRVFPFGGGVAYTLEDGLIELTSGRIVTSSTHATFDGRTRSGAESRIPFRVASSNWQESDRLMSAVMTAIGSPTRTFTVDGVGIFDGVMLGDLAAPRIEATFVGDLLRAWNVDWGAGAGDLVVENGYLDMTDGLFRQGDSEIQVDGRFALGSRDDGGEEINTVFTMEAFPASNLKAAFELEEGYSIDGPTSGEAHLYGLYSGIFGVGRITMDHPTAYGEPFDSVTAGLRFEGNGVRLDGLEMRKGEGAITGAAFVEWERLEPQGERPATYSFNWDARGIGVDTLVLIPAPPEPLSGTLEFHASGAGQFDNPHYEIRGTIVDLFVGDEEVGQVTGRLDVRDGMLSLDLEGASSTLAVSAAGQVALTAENDADLRFRVTNMSLDPYVRMFVPQLSPYTNAVISGSMRVVGELQNWNHLGGEAIIEQVDLSVFDYDIHNDGPIGVMLDQRVVELEQFRLVGEGTALELSGSVDLARDELSIGVAGDASLGILQGFLQDLRGSGDAAVRAEVTGPWSQPVLTGDAAVSDGRIRHFSLPHGLEAINGRIIFEPGGVRFDDVQARMGGGPVTIGGYAGLTGFQATELGITLAGQQMHLRYPEGFRSLIDTDLELRGDMEAAVLAGVVNVRDMVLLEGFDMTPGLFGSSDEEDVASVVALPDPWLPLSFDIQVVAPSTLRMTSNTMRIVSSAELTLRGTLDQPLLFGTAEIDYGEAFVEGNRYRLNYGTIGFANPTRIEPFIDIELETDVRVPGQTYRVTVRATGTVERLVPTLSSDPPLPEVDILSLLLGDIRDPQSADLRAARAPELAQQQRFQAGAARLLTSPLSSEMGRVIEESFGVDTFQITPSLGDPSAQQSAQLIPTARVLIGKRISDRGHLTLSRALSGANRDLIMVFEYDQSDRLSWILSQNEDRTYAIDFRVRHAF